MPPNKAVPAETPSSPLVPAPRAAAADPSPLASVPTAPAAPSAPTSSPSPDLYETTVVFDNESRNLITKNFTHFRENPFSFLRQISIHYSGTGWRAYNDIIGQPIFYKGFSEQMKERILKSALLMAKIAQLADRRAALEDAQGVFGAEHAAARAQRRERRRLEIEKQLNEVADGIVDGMICKFENKKFIRVRSPSPGHGSLLLPADS